MLRMLWPGRFILVEFVRRYRHIDIRKKNYYIFGRFTDPNQKFFSNFLNENSFRKKIFSRNFFYAFFMIFAQKGPKKGPQTPMILNLVNDYFFLFQVQVASKRFPFPPTKPVSWLQTVMTTRKFYRKESN